MEAGSDSPPLYEEVDPSLPDYEQARSEANTIVETGLPASIGTFCVSRPERRNFFVTLRDQVIRWLRQERRETRDEVKTELLEKAFSFLLMLYNTGDRSYKTLYELARFYVGKHRIARDRFLNIPLGIEILRVSVQNPEGCPENFYGHRILLIEKLLQHSTDLRTNEFVENIVRMSVECNRLTRSSDDKTNLVRCLNYLIFDLWCPPGEIERHYEMIYGEKVRITKNVYRLFPNVENAKAQCEAPYMEIFTTLVTE